MAAAETKRKCLASVIPIPLQKPAMKMSLNSNFFIFEICDIMSSFKPLIYLLCKVHTNTS